MRPLIKYVICTMQERNYKAILYFIIVAILGTLAMQGYWNYKNFEDAKQQLINDVQISLDNAVNNYYATKTQERFKKFTFIKEANFADSIVNNFRSDNFFLEFSALDSIATRNDSEVNITIDLTNNDGKVTQRIIKNSDTLKEKFKKTFTMHDTIHDRLFSLKNDSILKHPIAQLTSQVMYSLAAKTIELKTIDSLLAVEFERKNIDVSYTLYLQNPFGEDQSTGSIPDNLTYLTTQSNSSFLPKHSFLQLNFSNVTEFILKKNSIGFLISLLFVIAIIACLLYLLKIIKNQKQLAEVKNDLISNITHEFKTPLATIGAAMEGIQLFNKSNDIEKTQKYVEVSANQVSKLTIMVEKLLETATLDNENLELNIEETDLVHLLEAVTKKEAVVTSTKTVTFKPNVATLTYPVDPFHFENAINNLIDNALKYGGDYIEISITQNKNTTEILVSDNGNELTTTQSKQIFEKFYRVPKGNTHDVKGFGIGLYYTKAIIEKHNGLITVAVKPTTFKITLAQ